MNRKIRVGAVNYLNTKPLIYGFEQGLMTDQVDLLMDYPSKIAEKLKNDEIDVGLVPVAIIPEMKEYYIISDYCIGCNGEVGSVCLFSEVPLGRIEKILLDYQSITSVELLKILVSKYWHIDVELVNTTEDFFDDIKESTAGLIIGDRALGYRGSSTYRYDLGKEWQTFTCLPFVFAVWVSNKKLKKDFIEQFNATNNFGLEQLDDVIKQVNHDAFDLKKYYTSHIKYHLDDKSLKGLNFFFELSKIK